MSLSAAPLTSLFLSTDAQVLSVGARILESYAFRVSFAHQTPIASELGRGKRFDLAVFDHDSFAAAEFPETHKIFALSHVVFGILSRETVHQALDQRVHFTLQKPFTADLFSKTIKSAFGPIATGRRRCFRQDLRIRTSECTVVHSGETRALNSATIINVSQAGMCVQAGEILPRGAAIHLRFPPSEGGSEIKGRGTVVWAHSSGTAGIKLTEMDREEHRDFASWLEFMLPKADDFLPGPARTMRMGHPRGNAILHTTTLPVHV